MRRNFILSTIGILCIVVPALVMLSERILIGFWGRSNKLTPEILWPNANYLPPAKRIPGEYVAPMTLCDLDTRIPDDYVVYFRQSYTIEQHKQAVGDAVDLDLAIKRVFEETDDFGMHFSAQFSGSALAAVRSDVGVDTVECNGRGWLVE